MSSPLEPGNQARQRKATIVEDVLTHVILLVSLVFILTKPKMPPAAFQALISVIGVVVVVIFVRRQTRLNRLVKAMREAREAEANSPLMGMPPPPARLQSSVNGTSSAKVGRKRK